MSPSPNLGHQDIVGNLYSLLRQCANRHKLGKVYAAPLDVYLCDDTVVQPDVFFVSRERLPGLQDDGMHGAPDLVVEVLSPSNALLDAKRKRPICARHGVKELWLVDPLLRQIHRYDFATDAAKPVQIIDDDEHFETPLLPELRVEAAEVFRR